MKLLEGGKSMRKPEILAPAGNLEKLKIAAALRPQNKKAEKSAKMAKDGWNGHFF